MSSAYGHMLQHLLHTHQTLDRDYSSLILMFANIRPVFLTEYAATQNLKSESVTSCNHFCALLHTGRGRSIEIEFIIAP